MSNHTTEERPVPMNQRVTEIPEVRVHLAHLRAMDIQRLSGIHDPKLPRLRTVQVDPAALIPVTIRLSPSVIETFRATGKGWRKKINEVLMALVEQQER